jgi:hypothetical protein
MWKFLLCLGLLVAQITQADSTGAACGFAATVDAPRGITSACEFSQRQGFIRIYVDGGPEFDFRPKANVTGNYVDAEGQAVYRRSGLGKQGLIFQLPNRFLFVYWAADSLACARDSLASDQGCEINYGGLIFTVRATDAGSINQLTIQAAGLKNGPQAFIHEIDGAAHTAEVADLDANGWPEIYVYVSSAGSGSYGSLVAYAVNMGKFITPIYLPPLTDQGAVSAGYMGHDNFAVVESRLIQRFPVYRKGDTNSAPTGGMRQLQYRLVAGEAGWKLEVNNVEDY